MWLYKNLKIRDLSDIPEGVVGFVYMISNPDTKEYYFGKKSCYSNRTLKPLKGFKRKRKVTKESDWISYQSSNNVVKSWNNAKKEILHYCYTKKEMTYYELQAILCTDGLTDSRCLNENALGKFFKNEFKND
jgi:hypothetical protein